MTSSGTISVNEISRIFRTTKSRYSKHRSIPTDAGRLASRPFRRSVVCSGCSMRFESPIPVAAGIKLRGVAVSRARVYSA